MLFRTQGVGTLIGGDLVLSLSLRSLLYTIGVVSLVRSLLYTIGVVSLMRSLLYTLGVGLVSLVLGGIGRSIKDLSKSTK